MHTHPSTEEQRERKTPEISVVQKSMSGTNLFSVLQNFAFISFKYAHQSSSSVNEAFTRGLKNKLSARVAPSCFQWHVEAAIDHVALEKMEETAPRRRVLGEYCVRIGGSRAAVRLCLA
jgi:hypothetical protein